MRDDLGEYDDNEIPRDFALPVIVNQEYGGIVDASGTLFAFFNVIREEVPRLLAKRKCEFLCGLANGDIKVSDGKVFKKTSEKSQGGKLVVTYDLPGIPVEAAGMVRNPWGRAGRPESA